MRARQQFQLGRTAPAARQLAAVLHERPPTMLVAWTLVDAWALATRLALRSGNRGQAVRAVRRAVAVSSTFDVLRPLLQVDDVVELMREINWPPGLAAFTTRVLDARRERPAPCGWRSPRASGRCSRCSPPSARSGRSPKRSPSRATR
jgi:hypothetical protein